MKKCLSLLIALSMIASLCVFPVSAETTGPVIPDGAILIFAEDFESGYDSGNLLATSNDVTVKKNDKSVLKLTAPAVDPNAYSAEITTAEAYGFDSNVLKLTNTSTSNNMNAYLYLNGNNAVDFTTEGSPYYGKQLVVEYDAYTVNYNENDFMRLDSTAPDKESTGNTIGPFMRASNSTFPVRNGAYNKTEVIDGVTYRPYYLTKSYTMTKPAKMKIVFDQTGDIDVNRSYMNGTLLTTGVVSETAKNGSRYKGKEVKDFVGEYFDVEIEDPEYKVNMSAPKLLRSVMRGKGGTAEAYIDNVVVYAVDSIEFDSITSKDSVAGNLEVNFTAPFNADVNTFKITDSTNADVDAIESVTMSADKKTAIIKLKNVEELTTYKVWVDDVFTSEAGAIFYSCLEGIDASNEYVEISTFKTAKTLVVEEAPEAIENLIPSDPRTFDIKFSAALASVTATLAGNDVTTQLLDENKTVRIKFTEVAAGDLVINATGTAGQAATLTIPVTVATGIKGADIINDDLSGLTVGTDLLANATGTEYYNGNFGFSTAKRTVDAIAFDAEGNKDKVEVEADPDAAGKQGNVLKITNGTGGNTLAVNRMVDANRKASVNARGKVLVVESKYYIPATNAQFQSGDYANYNGLGVNWSGLNVSAYQRHSGKTGKVLYIAQGQYNAYPGSNGAYEGRYSRAEGTQTLPTGQWVTITNVYDLVDTATVTRPDTVRTYVDGVALGAKLKGTGAPTDLIYDLFPEGYYGEYKYDPATGELTGNQASTRGPANVATYTGAATGITSRTNVPVDSDPYVYYVDDYKVYTADDFKAEVVGDTETYTPNQVVKILFNSQIPEDQLAELYVVNKATGNKVEDATFTLANGGYAVDVQLPGSVAKDEVYTVVAPTTFHDVTYQPLKNNLDWTFDITIGEYVPFKGEIDTTEFNSFVSGKGETKATLTLSKAVNSTAGIVVKNAEDAVVTEGWNASLSSDGKTIVLNFTNLPTANYTVDFAGLTAADGDAIVNADELAITITAKVEKIMIFEEDFEGTDYTLDADWIDNAPTNGKWDFSVGAAVADDFIGVVSADNLDETAHQGKTAFAGNVLKLYNTGGTSARVLTARAKSQIGAIDIEKDYPNKVIVYEADVYVKSTTDGSRIFTPSFDSSASKIVNFMKYNNGTAWKIEGGNIYMDFGKGDYSQAYKFQTGTTGTIDGLSSSVKASHNVIAVDQRKEVDTIKISANDVQFSSKDWTLLTDHIEFGTRNYEFPMNAFITAEKEFDAGDFQGILLHTYAKATAAEIYVDNIKAYLVDAFEIESIEGASTAFNMAKDTVKINFTNKVKSAEEAAANIKLVDAEGNEVKDAIAVALTGNDYQVSVTLNEKVVTGAQEYTLVVSPAIRDVYGVSLASEYYFYKYQPKATTQTGYLLKKDGNTVMLFATLEEAEAQKKVAGWTSATIIEYSWTYDEASGKVKAFNLMGVAGKEGNDFLADTYTLDKNAMKLETVIKTTKATSLYAEATAAVVNGTNVSTSLTFTNPEEEALDVWYIVAAYGDYNEMIGCQAAALNVKKGTMDPIAINFTTKSSDIKSVKVYVWDGYKTMVPYQEAEELLK